MAFTTIDKPTLHFNTKLYTGNGSNGNAVTGVGFQPDIIWGKDRTNSRNHYLVDVIRGTGEELRPNSNNHSAGDGSLMASIDSDGFTVDSSNSLNNSGANYVSWNWKTQGSAGSANNDGSINTTTTSVNTTAGISISKFVTTGSAATVGHGLGVAPKAIWIKRTDSAHTWQCYHASIGPTKYLELNDAQAENTSSGRFNDTAPTSSVFSIGTEWGASATLHAYCFAEIPGFSRITKYVGNGNANGAFCYTGFKPAWVMIKSSSLGQNWIMYDDKRGDKGSPSITDAGAINKRRNYLYADGTNAESTGSDIDFLSNGFKTKNTSAAINDNNAVYTVIAFASEPLVGSNNVPAIGF